MCVCVCVCVRANVVNTATIFSKTVCFGGILIEKLLSVPDIYEGAPPVG